MGNLIIHNYNITKTYECQTTHTTPNYLVVDKNSYLNLTTATTTGLQMKIEINNENYRPMQTYTSTSSQSSQYTSTSGYSGVSKSTSTYTITSRLSGYKTATYSSKKTITIRSVTSRTNYIYSYNSLGNINYGGTVFPTRSTTTVTSSTTGGARMTAKVGGAQGLFTKGLQATWTFTGAVAASNSSSGSGYANTKTSYGTQYKWYITANSGGGGRVSFNMNIATSNSSAQFSSLLETISQSAKSTTTSLSYSSKYATTTYTSATILSSTAITGTSTSVVSYKTTNSTINNLSFTTALTKTASRSSQYNITTEI